MDKEDDTRLTMPVDKKSLLQKYDIPIERFSYDYISQCKNAKELERIVIVLRSGEEGCYPDLTRHAEERLTDVKPTSTVLRRAEPIIKRNTLEPENRMTLENDLSEWTREMRAREMDLEQGRSTQSVEEPITEFAIRQIPFDQPEKLAFYCDSVGTVPSENAQSFSKTLHTFESVRSTVDKMHLH